VDKESKNGRDSASKRVLQLVGDRSSIHQRNVALVTPTGTRTGACTCVIHKKNSHVTC